MTPERARELSQQAWHDMEDCKEWNAPLIKAILQACSEEREACAKIAENMEPDDHGRLSVEDIAAAIRGAK